MLLEKQKKEGKQQGHALQDYQMQLMLLEQQNKKKLMLKRMEEAAQAAAAAQTPAQAQQDQ
jgi:hypothetical protein